MLGWLLLCTSITELAVTFADPVRQDALHQRAWRCRPLAVQGGLEHERQDPQLPGAAILPLCQNSLNAAPAVLHVITLIHCSRGCPDACSPTSAVSDVTSPQQRCRADNGACTRWRLRTPSSPGIWSCMTKSADPRALACTTRRWLTSAPFQPTPLTALLTTRMPSCAFMRPAPTRCCFNLCTQHGCHPCPVVITPLWHF